MASSFARAMALVSLIALMLLMNDSASGTTMAGSRIPIHRIPQTRHTFTEEILSTGISISNFQGLTYLLQVSVGGQQFPFILDTGSSDLWVVSTDCKTTDCSGVLKYSGSASHSLSLSGIPFSLSYLVGSVTGEVGYETIALGQYKILNQVIAVANQTVGLGLSTTLSSGILGLAFPWTASISPFTGKTVVDNLFSNLEEDRRFFTYLLGRNSGPNDNSSSFTIGGLDNDIASKLSDLHFTPVSQPGGQDFDFWKLPLQAIIIDSTAFPLSPSRVPGTRDPIAVLDTGTALMLGPTSDVDAFWTAVGKDGASRKNDASSMWEVKCDRGISIGLVLGEGDDAQEYPVDPADISWEEGGSADGWCMGGIQANDGVNSGDWLLGAVFLRNVYVTHHGSNTTHPPLIGLRSMTDRSSSMMRFRKDRGPDSSTSGIQIQNDIPFASTPHTAAIYMISAASGFVGGALLSILVRLRHQSWKTSKINRKELA